jgi:hypothetical protein
MFIQAAIAESNGNVRLEVKVANSVRSLKMQRKNRKSYSKKLFSLNSSVMDNNFNTYKTVNIQIIKLVF